MRQQLINLLGNSINSIKSPKTLLRKIINKIQINFISFKHKDTNLDEDKLVKREFCLNTPAMVELENGLKLWGDLGDYAVSRAAMFGTYEPSETKYFQNLIPQLDDGMIIDIGANIGWFTILFAQSSRDVIAIEPRPNNFYYLKKNIETNQLSNVELINSAVADVEGRGIVFVLPSAGNSGGTHFRSNPSPSFTNELMQKGYEINDVPIRLIDEIVSSRKVALIKIDIEGAEPHALKGALNTLKISKPKILCELNPICLRDNGSMKPEEFLGFMESLNYRSFILNEDGTQGDQIYKEWVFGNEWKNIIFTCL